MECLKPSIYNLVIGFDKSYFFYFDNNGIYQKNCYDELPKDINLSLYRKYKYRNTIGDHIVPISQYLEGFIKDKYTFIGSCKICNVINSLKVGDTVDEFDNMLYSIFIEITTDPVFFNSKVSINKALIKNKVILRKLPYVYYFNSEGIFTRILEEECMLKVEPYVDAPASELITFPEWFSLERPEKMHVGRFRRAISSAVMRGESINRFEEMLNGSSNFTIPFKVNDVNDFITSITKPSFERRPENKNRNTFDFIRVYVNFCNAEDYKKYIKKNLKSICRIVLRKIDESKAFKKYGIPINFLKLTSAIICVDKSIELVFELKDLEK